MAFTVAAADHKTRARAGALETPHGLVETPVYMPVATQASVKAISSEDLETLGVRAILANAYHLALRPGTRIIQAAGGLHKFMGYDGMILTDSGGFQVMSLSDLREIDDDGVTFKSHFDGAEHRFTPEKVIGIQAELGSDCWAALDECPPYPADEKQALCALERTMRWADRSAEAVLKEREAGSRSLFFPIAQGSFYPELRKRAAEQFRSLPADGAALGGFSVGEPKELTWRTLGETIFHLPEHLPRYLMGVGTPDDLWDAVSRGVDMLDCVWPTRLARHGTVVTRKGRFCVERASCRDDHGPIDETCSCFVCARYSRAYLAHLFRSREIASHRLLSYHNLHFMAETMREIRAAILEGRFAERRDAYLEAYRSPAPA